MKGFNDFIENLELFDVLLIGGKYTWYKPNGKAKSRIDMILISLEWMEHGPKCKQYVKARQVFDHCALILKMTSIDWGPKPFRYHNAWNNVVRFKGMIKERWSTYNEKEDPMVVIKKKTEKLVK